MTSFLFWNIKNNPIESIIARLALRHEIDVIMLAECNIAPATLLLTLNESTDNVYYYVPKSDCSRIEIFTRFSNGFIPIINDELESDKYTIRHLKRPEATDIILSVVHLPSKLYKGYMDLTSKMIKLSESIKKAERTIDHSRTVIIGDLNMNPYEDSIIMASGLNGTMSRDIAQEKIRKIDKEGYPFFYNPMWNFLGDFKSDPPGTYYYRQAIENNIRWYIYDQVLIRPDLLPYFNIKDLNILTSDGAIDFLSNDGIPRKDDVSDHLPIIFKLDL
jgi:hypothetical protein